MTITLLLAVALRARETDRLAIEHFDEGVYASSTWYDPSFGEPYPMRHLYAPPLLPSLIRLASSIMPSVGPFVPSIVAGCVTVFVMWWLARILFGQAAGLCMASIVAFSDYHILFSRMALTDAVVLVFITASVAVAVTGLQQRSVRRMFLAGVLTGLAWWTKYTGWLPIAIVVSGSVFWWTIGGRRGIRIQKLLMLLLVFAAAGGLVWLPWFLMLKSAGGYSAVAANHSGYFFGTSGWQSRLASQIYFHLNMDSWLGAWGVGLGILSAGSRRWIELRLSDTRRTLANPLPGHPGSVSEPFPSPAVLRRFCAAAIVLAVVACGIGAIGVLSCLAIGGLAGMFLYPTLTELYRRKVDGDEAAPVPDGFQYNVVDFRAAPEVDPLLGFSIVLAWFVGLLLMTPMYYPYPRLSLPLLAAVWLGAVGGLAWWIEATLNVDRRQQQDVSPGHLLFMKRIVTAMVLLALAITASGAGSLKPPTIWQSRTSLRDASWQLASAVIQDARGNYAPQTTEPFVDQFGIYHPDPVEGDKAESDAELGSYERLEARVAPPVDDSTPLADLSQPDAVIYCYGEPAVLYHLNRAGLNCSPVQDLTFPAATIRRKALPTYLVIGPNTIRTDGMLYDWMDTQDRFERIDEFWFRVGDVVLFNLFSTDWISQQPDTRFQKLTLYRLKSD
ncbi:MAG: glycosyltransferase family 39 protein [Planctomycetaceae bacterium]|nr:glycosyltransferase family 39 protein [Planctomycetaceae bacterium]